MSPLTQLLQNRGTIEDVANSFWPSSPAKTAGGQVLQDMCLDRGITSLNMGTKGSNSRVPKHTNLHHWLVWDNLQSYKQNPRHNLHYLNAIHGWLYRTVVYDMGQLSFEAYEASDLAAFCAFNVIRQTTNTYVSFAQTAYWSVYPSIATANVAIPVSISTEYRSAERRAQVYRALWGKKLLPEVPGIAG